MTGSSASIAAALLGSVRSGEEKGDDLALVGVGVD
jgi:hypothetical protein